jgi:lactoylglutathione lyase
MPTQNLTLGYVILTVQDVAVSLAFYARAFGLPQRFFHDDGGKAYGELETGATRLAFISLTLANANLSPGSVPAARENPPQAVEIALVAADVQGAYAHALSAGALAVLTPTVKPWGQTIAYVRDLDGHLIELCSPRP